MRVHTLVLLVAALAVPSASLAQSPTAPGPMEVASEPVARAADCAWRDQARADQGQLALRLPEVQRALDARPLTGALIPLVISAALTVGGILTAALYRNSEYQAVPLLWTIPGVAAAGIIASGAALGVRSHQRKPFKAERKRLLRQKVRLEHRLQRFVSEGCVDIAAQERSATARVVEIDRQATAIAARAQSVPLLGPIVLMSLGGGLMVGGLVSGLILALIAGDAADHSEPHDRTPMRVAFGMVPVGAAALVGGGVWLAQRRQQRRAITNTGSQLELEKRNLEMELAPQLGPSSLGLSWRARF